MNASPEAQQLRINFCKQLEQHIKAANITQTELAALTGLKQSSISRILSGKFSPSLDLLLMIATAAGYTLQWNKL